MMYSKIDIFWIRVMYFVYKTIGIAPCSINVSVVNPRKKNKQVKLNFSNSTLGTIYNTILSLLVIVRSYFILCDLFFHDFDFPGEHDDIQMSLKLIKHLASILIILFFGIYYKCIVIMINGIIQLENELNKKLANFKQMNRRKLWLIFPFVIHMSILCSRIISHCLQNNSYGLYYFVERLPGFLLKSLLIQYATLINLLQKNYLTLNKSLHLLGNPDIELGYHLIIVRNVQHEERLNKNIILIAKAQRILYATCQKLANFYSILILIVNAFFCGSLIYDSYNMVLAIFLSLPLSFIINTVTLTTSHAYPIIILSLSVTKLISEIKTTSIIVHQLMATQTTHTRILYELEQLSLELLHRKVSFTACGLFSIDNSFLVSVLSTTITYLMILIQYDQSHSSKDKSYWNNTALSIKGPVNEQSLNASRN